MCFVETPLWIQVELGNCFITGAPTAKDQARILAIDQYPGIMLIIVPAVLQPTGCRVYFFLNLSSFSSSVDMHKQRSPMNGICDGKVGSVQNANCMRMIKAFQHR